MSANRQRVVTTYDGDGRLIQAMLRECREYRNEYGGITAEWRDVGPLEIRDGKIVPSKPSDPGVLSEIRENVTWTVENAVREESGGWLDLLPAYLLFHLIERLESIDDHLSALRDEQWSSHHGK